LLRGVCHGSRALTKFLKNTVADSVCRSLQTVSATKTSSLFLLSAVYSFTAS
jgi:hypothetical protein